MLATQLACARWQSALSDTQDTLNKLIDTCDKVLFRSDHAEVLRVITRPGRANSPEAEELAVRLDCAAASVAHPIQHNQTVLAGQHLHPTLIPAASRKLGLIFVCCRTRPQGPTTVARARPDRCASQVVN